jgi:peptide/nickel transport system permease protein
MTVEATVDVEATGIRKPAQSVLAMLWREGRLGVIGGAIIVFVVLAAIFGPTMSPFDPLKQDLLGRLQPPGAVNTDGLRHIMGSDALGRDVFTRVLVGARYSLVISVLSVVGAMLIGTMAGLVAGFRGGRIDDIVMRLVDVQLSFPIVLLALTLVAILGPSGGNVVLVFVLTGWPIFARTTRASTLVLRSRDFVEAAVGMGSPSMTILRRHILPNALAPLTVVATFELAKVLIFESSLSFLGLGVQPPTPTWGNMMSEGRSFLENAWWITFFPGMALVFTAAAFNWLGDGLNAVIDPRQRRRR